MKTPAVKGLFEYHMAAGHRAAAAMVCAAAAVLFAATPLVGRSVTIDVTKAQQRYPWNGLVDIDYTITLGEGESAFDPALYYVEITVVNHDVTPAVTNVASMFRNGNPPVSDGAHRVTWDANADGVDFVSRNAEVVAKIFLDERPYMVIDVSKGPNETEYPVTYLKAPPTDGFNAAEYKSGKIVLRRIMQGSFTMGSPESEPGRKNWAAREVQHNVTISKPFFIGIFEITQEQYLNVMGGNNPSEQREAYHPIEKVDYSTVRGTAAVAPWPYTNDDVAGNSFMGKLRAKCKAVTGIFDLPTDAQWEYACRAGTTTPFNNGVSCTTDEDLETQIAGLGRYTKNGSGHAAVGAYAPNDWGLYDMHGNVWEWCLDWYKEDVQNIDNPSVDPVGPATATGNKRVVRGGSFDNEADRCRSAGRFSTAATTAGPSFGFRLSMSFPLGSRGESSALDSVNVAYSAVGGDEMPVGAGRTGRAAVDLRTNDVLVVRRSNELMPFTWSSTNFTGVVGLDAIDPESVASVRVVQVTGEGDDVSQWTTEVDGTATTLVAEQQGEGAVKWKGVQQGVWKAELVIAPPAGEAYRETRILDLRKYSGQGLMLFFLK